MIELSGVTRTYAMDGQAVRALANVNLEIDHGEFVVIVGPPGSGKSTLLNILGGLDVPTRGDYNLDGMHISAMDEEQRAMVRNRTIGMVFEAANLVPRLPALRQVELPLFYRHVKERTARASAALAMVGLKERLRHRPAQLSGGEQQRVAIARALIANPTLVLADEPTGSLDPKTGREIMLLLQAMNRLRGISVVCATHNHEVAAFAGRVIEMQKGHIVRDSREHKQWAVETPIYLPGAPAVA